MVTGHGVWISASPLHFALLAIPLIRTSYLHTAPDVPSSDKWLAIASAAGAALLGWLLVTSGRLLLRMLRKRTPLRRPRAVISYWIYERLQVRTLVTRTHTLEIQTYRQTSTTQRLLRAPADTIFHKAQAWAFFLLTFILYAARQYRPAPQSSRYHGGFSTRLLAYSQYARRLDPALSHHEIG